MGLAEKQLRFLADFRGLPIEIKSAEGAVLRDREGRSYIDFLSAYCVVNSGWGRKEIIDAIRRFDEPAYAYPFMLHEGCAELAELLARIAPGRLRKAYRLTGGSEAVDVALQCAISKTGRSAFLCYEGAYHGHTLAELAVTEEEGFLASKRIPPPFDPMGRHDVEMAERSAEILRKELRTGKYAGFIFEPISMNHGAMIPPKEFYDAAAEECARSGTIMIADEVACGFGRTGKMFACEHYALEPDVMTLAKGMSSGYAPIGTAMVTEEVQRAMRFYVYSTFGWTPLATRATLANIKLIQKERLWENADRVGRFMLKRISEIRDERVASVRGRGLMIGVALSTDGKRVDAELCKRVSKACLERGLIVTHYDSGLGIYPPLSIDEKTAERGIEILESALRSV